MKFNDQTPVMTLGNLPFTHSISPFMGVGGTALGQIEPDTLRNIAIAITVAGGILSGAHGYYRSKNIAWTLVWTAIGAIFPVPTVAYAAGQGFAKRKRG